MKKFLLAALALAAVSAANAKIGISFIPTAQLTYGSGTSLFQPQILVDETQVGSFEFIERIVGARTKNKGFGYNVGFEVVVPSGIPHIALGFAPELGGFKSEGNYAVGYSYVRTTYYTGGALGRKRTTVREAIFGNAKWDETYYGLKTSVYLDFGSSWFLPYASFSFGSGKYDNFSVSYLNDGHDEKYEYVPESSYDSKYIRASVGSMIFKYAQVNFYYHSSSIVHILHKINSEQYGVSVGLQFPFSI